MPSTMTQIELAAADGEVGITLDCEIEYNYTPGGRGSRSEPAFVSEAYPTKMRFRVAGRPAYGYSPERKPGEWQENPLLYAAMNTEGLCDWLVDQYEGSDHRGMAAE